MAGAGATAMMGATAVVSAAVAGATAVGDCSGTGGGLDGIGAGGCLDPGLGGGGGGGSTPVSEVAVCKIFASILKWKVLLSAKGPVRTGRIYTTTGPAGFRPGPGRGPGVDFYVVSLV